MVGADYAPRAAQPYPPGYVQPPFMQVPGVPSSAYPPAIYPRQTATGITMSSNPGAENWPPGNSQQGPGLQALLARLFAQFRGPQTNPGYQPQPIQPAPQQMGGFGGPRGTVPQAQPQWPQQPQPAATQPAPAGPNPYVRDNLLRGVPRPSSLTPRPYPMVQAW